MDFTYYREILDSVDEQIAVIDATGSIRYVNRSWIRFAGSNGLPEGSNWKNINYLQVCSESARLGDESANEALQGIKKVMSGDLPVFIYEYPCHSPAENRWFILRAMPLCNTGSMFVVLHINITERKLAEFEVQRLTLTDPLTGLANRRHFDRFIKDEWARSLRYQTCLSLIMIDVDNFKQYNDSLGHPAGDDCLRRIGTALGKLARRPGDMAARYGGEEFAVILGGTGLEEAGKIAGEIRGCVQDLNIPRHGGGVVTISLGVASMVPEGEANERDLIQRSDEMLYRAKSAGKNRVEFM